MAIKKYTLYTITCLVNNKIYIGVCGWYPQRINKHKSDLKNGKHSNTYLQNEYNKHGESEFVYDVVGEYTSRIDAIRVEKYYIDVIFGLNKDVCFNILKGGSDVTEQIRRRYKQRLSEEPELRARVSANMSKIHKGKVLSDETKNKIRDKAIGRKASAQTKLKMGDRKRGGNNTKARKVVDTSTGKIYGCLKDAVPDFYMSYEQLRWAIKCGEPKTTLKWL